MLEAIVIGAVGTIITITLGWLGSLIKNVLANQKEEREEANVRRDKVEAATLATTRVLLVQTYYQIMARGFMTAFEKEAYENLYKVYRELGGNSFVTGLHDELMNLPIKDTRTVGVS